MTTVDDSSAFTRTSHAGLLEDYSPPTIKEPLAFKIARVLVILVLLAAFSLILVVNLKRPTNSGSQVQGSKPVPLQELRLHPFNLLPYDNHTLITSLNCSYDKPVNASPTVTQTMADDSRQMRIDAWNEFQSAKASVPNHQSMSDAEVLQQLEDGNLLDLGTRLFIKDLLEPLRNSMPTFDERLSRERWGRYSVADGRTLPSRASSITCRVGKLVEISAENATSTTPTLLQPSNVTAVGFKLRYWEATVPLIRGQHTVLVFELSQTCSEAVEGLFTLSSERATECHNAYTHKLSSVRSSPASAVLLPPSLQNEPTAEYAYVTIRIKNAYEFLDANGFADTTGLLDANGLANIATTTRKFDNGVLAKLASIFSTISILLLVYRLAMGDMKRNPFGWIQRYILRWKTKQFVKQVNATKGRDEWVENVLFTLYLDGNGLHYRKHGFLKRLRKKLKRFRKDKKQEDASSMV